MSTYFNVYRNPKYGLMPIVLPHTSDASKNGPYGSLAAMMAFFCLKLVRFSLVQDFSTLPIKILMKKLDLIQNFPWHLKMHY